jgi:hypothetical protein
MKCSHVMVLSYAAKQREEDAKQAAAGCSMGRRGQATNGNCGFEIGSCELAIT